jgi:hypothetical protein
MAFPLFLSRGVTFAVDVSKEREKKEKTIQSKWVALVVCRLKNAFTIDSSNRARER